MSRTARCPQCNGYPRETRLTVPRATSGDLEFCGYHCYERWDAAQQSAPAPATNSRHPEPAAVAARDETRCRSCNAPVIWGETPNGKRAPFNADGVNHFVTCPQRREWRKAEQPVQASLFGAEDVTPSTVHRQPWEG